MFWINLAFCLSSFPPWRAKSLFSKHLSLSLTHNFLGVFNIQRNHMLADGGKKHSIFVWKLNNRALNMKRKNKKVSILNESQCRSPSSEDPPPTPATKSLAPLLAHASQQTVLFIHFHRLHSPLPLVHCENPCQERSGPQNIQKRLAS